METYNALVDDQPADVKQFIRKFSRLLVFIPGLVVLIFLFSGVKSVSEYESCLLIRNGTIRDEWEPGLHWHFPLRSDVSCYRTARTTYEASPGERSTGADFNDEPVEARTQDGQRIDAVSFRIAFRIPTEMTRVEGVVSDDNHQFVYSTVGASSQDAVVSSVVAFYARPEVRAVMQLHTSKELLEGDLSIIGQEIEDRLRPQFAENGVLIDSFLLSKPDFNDDFELKLQEREQAAIDVEIEKQRALLAEQQGESRINAADADAEVLSIEAEAEASRTLTQAEAEANALVTLANAEATAISVQVAAFGGQTDTCDLSKLQQ